MTRAAEGYNPHPDVVLHSGQVLTVDRSFSIGQALALKADRIVAVGSDEEVLATAGGRTRRIDLAGRTALPGFVDTHAHMDREGLRRAYPSLEHCRSIADVQAVVRQAAAQRRPGEWVVILPLGEPPFHLDQELILQERRYPDRRDLDQAAPNNPVWIRSIWGYWSNSPPFVHVLNSAALRACGIDRDTPPPTSTLTIERDPETGELTGRILESHILPAAEFTLLRAAPRFSHEIRREALVLAMRLSAAAGTTSVYEGHGVAAELHKLYKELHDAGEQCVRAHLPISPPWSSVDEAERMMADWAHYAAGPGFGDDWLKVGGLYLDYGGEPELAAISRAAWPYTGWAGFAHQYNSPGEYRRLCRLAAKHRLRVGTNVGLAVDDVLSIWTEVHEEHPIDELRWVLVHGRLMEPERDYPRIKRLGLVVTTQPASYVYRSGLSLVEAGADENRLLAHRDFVEQGIPWALSTDNKPYWLLFTLWAAVTRRERTEGRVIGPLQKIGVPEALRALTRAGAYVCFEEHKKGSLEVGKLADLIVLSADPLRIEPDALKEIQVELTMVGGRVVHDQLNREG